jgi:ubiquinone/menaquinone biosynthesis C-methylase UbiE
MNSPRTTIWNAFSRIQLISDLPLRCVQAACLVAYMEDMIGGVSERLTRCEGLLIVTMRDLLSDLSFIVSQDVTGTANVYDRAAPRYDHFRDLWLKAAGEQTENAMVEGLRSVLRPGARVLDAGAGTGAMSRQVLAAEPDAHLTMVDMSPNMLRQAPASHGSRVLSSVLELPFPDESFDLVVSSWVIETVPDPCQAVSEFLRVISPDGYVLYSFCSLPDGWLSRAGSRLFRKAVKKGFAGNFLDHTEEPWHDCSESRIARFHGGLSSFIVLRKCCSVAAAILPGSESSPAESREKD